MSVQIPSNSSSMTNTVSSNGFLKAPVSKYLLVSLSTLATVASYFNLSHFFLPSMDLTTIDHYTLQQLPRLFISKFMFSSAQEYFTGGLLIYHFRWVERMYGSRKYLYFLFSTTLATLFEYSTVCIARSLGWRGSVAVGPYPMIFAMLYAFQACTPSPLKHDRVLGFPFSFHAWLYILSINLLFKAWPSLLVPAFCGYLSGALFVHGISPCLSSFSSFFYPPYTSSSSSSSLSTATTSTTTMSMPVESSLFNENHFTSSPSFNSISSSSSSSSSSSMTSFEDYSTQLETLKSMGFDEQHILQVLHQVNGDVQRAVHVLLES